MLRLSLCIFALFEYTNVGGRIWSLGLNQEWQLRGGRLYVTAASVELHAGKQVQFMDVLERKT